MFTFTRTWFLAAAAFAAAFVIEDWFGASLYTRVLITTAAASAVAAIIQRSRPAQPPGAPPFLTTPSVSKKLPASELDLAIEHVQSIRVLLQVSASHNQPVPRAVLVNLDLVLKNLKKLKGTPSSFIDERTPDPVPSASTLTAYP